MVKRIELVNQDGDPKVTPAFIRYLREEVYGETKAEFAQRCGCSTRTVENWEYEMTPLSAMAERIILLLYREAVHHGLEPITERTIIDAQSRTPSRSRKARKRSGDR